MLSQLSTIFLKKSCINIPKPIFKISIRDSRHVLITFMQHATTSVGSLHKQNRFMH